MKLSTLDILRKKILSGETLKHQLGLWRFFSKKIVFTNGCFDLLHLGHIDYLSKAADLGDVLVVGVNSDDSTRRLKGPNRPVNNQEQRTILLAALHFVDAVVIFEEDTPYELIKTVQPDVLVKGSDYNPSNISGADIVLAKGGSVQTIDFLPGYSSTAVEKRILEAKR